MQLVYIAGPYRAKTIHGIHQNIEKAREVAFKYWGSGRAVICPHMNSALIDGLITDEQILLGCMIILSKCDAIVMMQGWQESKGSIDERDFALKHNIEVIYD
jgi:hypothetical protein